MKKIEAHIVLARCPNHHNQLYGIRMEKRGNAWYMTWAFPIQEKKAKSEGYDQTVLTGSFEPTDSYNGCPACGAKNFLRCPECGKISCFNGEEFAVCAWCGLSGSTYMQDEMSLKGGTM